MITYELAKQLKEAGFPQPDLFNKEMDGKNKKWYALEHSGAGRVYIPTLEELIDACGDNIFRIEKLESGRGKGKWGVLAKMTLIEKDMSLGRIFYESDLETAVAKFWLNLKTR